jgi:hypothetical protein
MSEIQKAVLGDTSVRIAGEADKPAALAAPALNAVGAIQTPPLAIAE